MAEGILNYHVYNDRMRRSMWDKAFFMDKIPLTEAVVDYGCADGSLIRFLQALFPGTYFVGYDIDEAMVAAANAQRRENTWFFTDQEAVRKQLQALGIAPERTAVNFSSVFHEIFAYHADPDGIRRFLEALSPRYIVVRDMQYRSADDAALLDPQTEARVRSVLPREQTADFEAVFGSIRLRKNLTHLLLKIDYTENWPRECREDYFSVSAEGLMGILDPDGRFRTLYEARYTLPWVRLAAERRFGIDLGRETTTHFAMILERHPDPAPIPLDVR